MRHDDRDHRGRIRLECGVYSAIFHPAFCLSDAQDRDLCVYCPYIDHGGRDRCGEWFLCFGPEAECLHCDSVYNACRGRNYAHLLQWDADPGRQSSDQGVRDGKYRRNCIHCHTVFYLCPYYSLCAHKDCFRAKCICDRRQL